MTRKEFWGKETTWKSHILKAMVKPPTYKKQMFHLAINMQSDVKHTLMCCLLKSKARPFDLFGNML